MVTRDYLLIFGLPPYIRFYDVLRLSSSTVSRLWGVHRVAALLLAEPRLRNRQNKNITLPLKRLPPVRDISGHRVDSHLRQHTWTSFEILFVRHLRFRTPPWNGRSQVKTNRNKNVHLTPKHRRHVSSAESIPQARTNIIIDDCGSRHEFPLQIPRRTGLLRSAIPYLVRYLIGRRGYFLKLSSPDHERQS